MKKVFLVALLFVGITTFAQNNNEKRQNRRNLTSEQKIEKQLDRLKSDLNLDERQTAEVKDLITKRVAKQESKKAEMEAIKEKNRANMKAKLALEEKETSAAMKKILTNDQYAKWEQNRAEKKEKVLEKIKERRAKR